MKDSKIFKIVILMITFMLITCMTTTVFAEGELDFGNMAGDTSTDETDDVPSLDGTIGGGAVEPENQTPVEPESQTPVEPETPTTEQNPSTDLPHAGVEDTILMITAFIVCAIIGGYTFIKLSEYSNI